MQIPVTQWTLHARSLPQRLLDGPKEEVFSLPGADTLDAFADLIGTDAFGETAAPEGVPYALNGLVEEDLCGELTLTKEIDFGALAGDRALLVFSQILGSGEVYLDDACIARFGGDMQLQRRQAYEMTGMPCALCVDVSGALRLGRRAALRLRFDASRPAGVAGAAFLSVTQRAHLSRVSILPDARYRTMTVRAQITAQREGRFILRVQAVSGKSPDPARETDVVLSADETRGVQLALSLDAPKFVPGRAYDAPALKIQLLSQDQKEKPGILCDETLLLCGYPGAAPGAYLPLDESACQDDAKALCAGLADLGMHAVSVPASAPDMLYPALTRSGVAAICHVSEEIRPMFMRYPCVTLADAPLDHQILSPAAAAWQMTGNVAFPRALDPSMTDEEMLLDASGKRLNGHDQGVLDTLAWLRVVQIRMRAEAARQGRYQGALCSAKESRMDDVRDALRTAFAPVHLSALPLCGAWWTGTHFSASLEAFIPEKAKDQIHACAVLEDDDGAELARFDAPCAKSGYLGVIEAQLPNVPCVLTLRCMILEGEKNIEESIMPVYVGERGPLEAAF